MSRRRTRNMRKRRKPRKKNRVPKPLGVVVSTCAMNYLKAKVEPFSGFSGSVCVPDPLVVPSRKIKLTTQGSLATSLTGVGYIEVTPYMPTTTIFGHHTNANSVGAGTTIANSFTNKTNMTWRGALLTDGNIDEDDTAFRPVAVAIRIRYIGPVGYRAGQYCITQSAVNKDLNLDTLDSWCAQATDGADAIPEGWITVGWRPISTADYSYRDAVSNPMTIGIALYNTYDGTGAIGPAAFEYEVVGYFEVIGESGGSPTSSEADVVGFSAVQSVVHGNVKGAPKNMAEARSKLYDHLETQATRVVSAAADGLTDAAIKTGAAYINRRWGSGSTAAAA